MLKRLLKDEDGDLIQNVIWILGGILTGVVAVNTLFTSVKTKFGAVNTSVNGIAIP